VTPAYLWAMSDGPLTRTIILWSKTVIVIVGNPGGRSVMVTAHEDHAHARDAALEQTDGEEVFGLTLETVIAAEGWDELPITISSVQSLYLIGQQQQALMVLAQSIAREIIDTGKVLA
jgi:hypothetical protein